MEGLFMVLIHNGTLQNGMFPKGTLHNGMAQNGTLQKRYSVTKRYNYKTAQSKNGTCYKMVHYKTVQLRNGTFPNGTQTSTNPWIG